MKQEIMSVVAQKELAPSIFELTLKGELVKEMVLPGQFIHIRVPRADLLMRRPISLATIDHEASTCTIIYRVEGDGTKVFSELVQGDTLDVLGPLGNGFDLDMIEKDDVVYVIGGGIGVPPLHELGRQLYGKEAKITFMNGFADQSLIYYEKEFEALGDLRIATDNGTYGTKGHVGNLISEAVKHNDLPKAVYACGAPGLLRAVEAAFPEHPHVYLSMEARMACGVGACYACVCQSKKDLTDNKKVCDDGPIFKTGEIVI